MNVREIVSVVERDRAWVGSFGRRCVVEPLGGLNVVLRTRGMCAARSAASKRSGAESLEKVIGSAIFLKDNDDVLKVCNLRVGERYSKEDQEKQTKSISFHGVLRTVRDWQNITSGEKFGRGKATLFDPPIQ